MKLIEYDTGIGKGLLVIPEGRKGCGWDGFVTDMREMVGSSSSVSAHVHRASQVVASRANGVKYMVLAFHHKGSFHHVDSSFASVLLERPPPNTWYL